MSVCGREEASVSNEKGSQEFTDPPSVPIRCGMAILFEFIVQSSTQLPKGLGFVGTTLHFRYFCSFCKPLVVVVVYDVLLPPNLMAPSPILVMVSKVTHLHLQADSTLPPQEATSPAHLSPAVFASNGDLDDLDDFPEFDGLWDGEIPVTLAGALFPADSREGQADGPLPTPSTIASELYGEEAEPSPPYELVVPT